MSGVVKVTFGELEAAGSNIGGAASKVQSSLDDLKSRLAPLVADWGGEAQESYRALQAQWDQAANDLQQVLQSISVAVHSANEAYQAGEKQNVQRFAN